MKTTIATRFRCRRPLTDLTQLTLMFLTLILQYLNKLVERQGRRLCVPKAFHTVKVQAFQWKLYQTSYKVHLPVAIENLCVGW